MVLLQWRRWKRARFHIHIVGRRFWQLVAKAIHVGSFWEDGTAGHPPPRHRDIRLVGCQPRRGSGRVRARPFFAFGCVIDGPSTKEPAGNLESASGRLSTR